MTRDKSLDGVFLHNFFKHRLEFFTKAQPANEQFLDQYYPASDEWLPLRDELDSYPIPFNVKRDLVSLFELAKKYYIYAIAAQHTSENFKNMREVWQNMRNLATSIQDIAKRNKLYTDANFSN